MSEKKEHTPSALEERHKTLVQLTYHLLLSNLLAGRLGSDFGKRIAVAAHDAEVPVEEALIAMEDVLKTLGREYNQEIAKAAAESARMTINT